MNKGMINGFLLSMFALMLTVFSFSANAKNSAFWDTLSANKATPIQKYKPRTRWTAPRRSQIKQNRPKTQSKYAASSKNRSCYVKTARQLPRRCIKKTRATRKGIVSQINYLNSSYAKQTAGLRYANYQNVGNQHLLGTARSLLNWFDRGSAGALANNFELYSLDSRSSRVKYTGYFTPSLSARKYPNREYRFPIYASPKNGHYPTRAEIFSGALRGQGLEIAWTNDPVGYYEMQVQGSGSLSFPDGQVRELHFAGKTPAKFVRISRYMQRKGYIKRPADKEVRRWLEKNPQHLKKVLAVNPRFVFFSLEKRSRTRKTASGQPLIAGHTVAVDTQHIPFGSVLLAEVPLRNSYGKVTRTEWRLLFPQDRGGAIKGTQRLDLYTGKGSRAKRLTRAITGMGRAYLLVNKSRRRGGEFTTAARR